MAALRGKKKAPAGSAKRKVSDKTSSTTTATASPHKRPAKQRAEARSLDAAAAFCSSEENLVQLMQFMLHASLRLQTLPFKTTPGASSVAQTCNTLLTAFWGGKERQLNATQILSKLSRTARKSVCGGIFTADEIAYSCRNCQVDSTCVICKDCFLHSDHTGHDVYFQRTTAGSSCDCGDVQAWKKSGFCTRHPGNDGDGRASSKHLLPKSLSLTAPAIIETIVDFIYQVFLAIDQGFELAECCELLTKDIPPNIVSELTTGDTNKSSDSTRTLTGGAPTVPRTRNPRPERRRGRNQAPPPPSSRSATPPSSKSGDESVVSFAIRLHNDDVHSFPQIINALIQVLECPKQNATKVADTAHDHGQAAVSKRALVECIGNVGNGIRKTLNVSLSPLWLDKQLEYVKEALQWLHFISGTSDGLSELIGDALCKERSTVLRACETFSTELPESLDLESVMKHRSSKLHPSAVELFSMFVKEGKQELRSWAQEQEDAQRELFHFSTNDSVPSAVTDELHCNNVFIEAMIREVVLSPAYQRNECVRDGVQAVTRVFFKSTSDHPTSTSTALRLLVERDCVMARGTVELSHSLLREQLLERGFRRAMTETYLLSYKSMTESFLKGLGNSSESIMDFGVQFFTVPNLVKKYTRREAEANPGRPNIMSELLNALHMVLKAAVDPKTQRLNVDHPAINSQKYKHCIDNIEYVLNIGSIPNELVCDAQNRNVWLDCLRILQNGDIQVRRRIDESHVEFESDRWLSMFNLGIRIHTIFSYAWTGFTKAELDARKTSIFSVFQPIIDEVIGDSINFNSRVPRKDMLAVGDIPGTTLESEVVSLMKSHKFDVAAQPTSLHIPLHRFLSSSLRHICIYKSEFSSSIESEGFLKLFGLHNLPIDNSMELIELPLRSLVMASQIHANMWRRNGDESMLAQIYNYSALPYCVHYRDSDVFLMQIGCLMVGPEVLLAKMVDHYQLCSYFLCQSDSPINDQQKKIASHIGFTPLEDGIDEQQLLAMLEEFLRLIIVVGTSLPSATGSAYEDAFLVEEMLQQLCAKPCSFSRLLDIAVLPTGQDDISISRLEGALSKVSNFVPPSGLDAGRYELKDGMLEHYNPYYLHLTREAHEQARDQWTSFRKTRYLKQNKSEEPKAPLKAAPRPVKFLEPVMQLLTCRGTVSIVQVVLWRLVRAGAHAPASSNVSDAVISTCLHLLAHGVHTATDQSAAFWSLLCERRSATDDLAVVHLLVKLLEKKATLLDSEQSETIEWLLWKMKQIPKCSSAIQDLQRQENRSTNGGDSSKAAALSLDERKAAARKRALEAMAKQQAAFQAMMSIEDDESDNDDGESKDDASSVEEGPSSKLGKRKGSGAEAEDEQKRQRVETQVARKCILCHDSSKQEEMGMVAYVHQSTVLCGAFRPGRQEALTPEGEQTRKRLKTLLEKMELCSGGVSETDMETSPSIMPLSAPFPEWYMDAPLDDALSLDMEFPDAPPPRHIRMQPPNARERRNENIFGGEFLESDDELQMLQGVLELPETTQSYPLDAEDVAEAEQAEHDVARPRAIRRRRHLSIDSETDEDGPARPHHHTHSHRLPPGFAERNQVAKLFLTPCGLHVRTCQHAVHMQCLEGYITSLHDKAIRGEEFDGSQAIDPDSAMTQFLCPLCKTLCNFLIPASDPAGEQVEDVSSTALVAKGSKWFDVVKQHSDIPTWFRVVMGRDGNYGGNLENHDLWRYYFEETLWEPHGSLEKGAPYLWSACAFSLASFLEVLDEEHRSHSSPQSSFDPLVDTFPQALEKELSSLSAITKFCRWSFSLLEHSSDAKVIWETAKRCCPIHKESKREYRKFTKVLGSIDACVRGTILGLLVADTFTAFVVSSVIAVNESIVAQSIPVFSVADILQRLYAEFFEQKQSNDTSLFQDKYTLLETEVLEKQDEAPKPESGRVTRSGKSIAKTDLSSTKSDARKASISAIESMIKKLSDDQSTQSSDEISALTIMKRMLTSDSSEQLKAVGLKDFSTRLQRIIKLNSVLVRRMKLFWKCLRHEDDAPSFVSEPAAIVAPSLREIANTPEQMLDQIWHWCVDRLNSKTHLGIATSGDNCEHTDGCSEAYVASMFILRDTLSTPRLVELPVQYDELYSHFVGKKCNRCDKVPAEPGLCLVCGEYLCCGDSCCTRPYITHGPAVGECTRHAAECGGGVGIVLLLDQCRVALIGGSMAAYFPCPYVDAHGEEDIGLQRGRPLRLDSARYRYLESLWVNHRLFSEVSRQRNQRDPQHTINFSYL
ncbi:TPA: hypothetical protein N0F65_001813 [Lagenidium giganteum]|uniref:E3 ubiquitin-protein ligase n=1 Tax=Lagenidium giganteum TaxID=4803 RepID=A0AAV2Z7L9_9STRA|nr:TPA: hypothetical protein N0F65_001813 [Lagenidium giganteum]